MPFTTFCVFLKKYNINIQQNWNENLETLHLAPTQFCHLPGFDLKQGFLILILCPCLNYRIKIYFMVRYHSSELSHIYPIGVKFDQPKNDKFKNYYRTNLHFIFSPAILPFITAKKLHFLLCNLRHLKHIKINRSSEIRDKSYQV